MNRSIAILVTALIGSIWSLLGRVYVKLNVPYALIGIVHPQVETTIAPHIRSEVGRYIFAVED